MKYCYLALQILFLLWPFLFSPQMHHWKGDKYFYKKYLFAEAITQSLCLVVGVVMLFVAEKFMLYVFVTQLFLATVILSCCQWKAKKNYFNELTNNILENNLVDLDVLEIRNYLLKKYDTVYSIDDIKKSVARIQNNK